MTLGASDSFGPAGNPARRPPERMVGSGGCLEVSSSVALQQVETFGWGGRGLSFDAEFLPATKLNFLVTPGSFRWLKTEQNIQRRPYRRRPPGSLVRRSPEGMMGNGGCLEEPSSVAFQQIETFGWG